MTDGLGSRQTRVLVILNPKAGNSTPDDVREAFDRHFPPDRSVVTIYETTGEERLPEVVRDYQPDAFDIVVAVGGDGTVSDVAEGLAGSSTPLGIVPLGTGNVLARDLGIPLDLEGASSLLAGAHALDEIDGMRVGESFFFASIGVGLDSLMVRDTDREAKRRFKRLAYAWTVAKSMYGYRHPRFTIVADGARTRRRAMQVLVANTAAVGVEPLRWGPHIRPDDGVVDICIVGARSVRELLGVLGSALIGRQRQDPRLRYLRARRSVTIVCDQALPVQADGEILGETPVQIEVVPGAIRVVVPPEPAAAANDLEASDERETTTSASTAAR